MKKIYVVTVVFLVFSGMLCHQSQASEEKETAALKAAESWLSLVDKGDYEECWRQSSSYFQKAVNMWDWVQALNSVRRPLGTVRSRQILSKTYTTQLAGAPDGEYVVIQFKTIFAGKPSSIELVTPMLEKNGSWRVSGYYIK